MGDRHADAVGHDSDRDWKAVRHALGLKRPELANKLGCDSRTVSCWERKEDVTPSIAYQRQMLSMLDDGE